MFRVVSFVSFLLVPCSGFSSSVREGVLDGISFSLKETPLPEGRGCDERSGSSVLVQVDDGTWAEVSKSELVAQFSEGETDLLFGTDDFLVRAVLKKFQAKKKVAIHLIEQTCSNCWVSSFCKMNCDGKRWFCDMKKGCYSK